MPTAQTVSPATAAIRFTSGTPDREISPLVGEPAGPFGGNGKHHVADPQRPCCLDPVASDRRAGARIPDKTGRHFREQDGADRRESCRRQSTIFGAGGTGDPIRKAYRPAASLESTARLFIGCRLLGLALGPGVEVGNVIADVAAMLSIGRPASSGPKFLQGSYATGRHNARPARCSGTDCPCGPVQPGCYRSRYP